MRSGGGFSNFIYLLAEIIRDFLTIPLREIIDLLNRILKRLDNRITDNTEGRVTNAGNETGQAVNDPAHQADQISRIPAPPARLAIEAGNQ